MKKSSILQWKFPKNMGVAPQFDSWNKKHEPWEKMRRMGRLAGTGFYIPPEWYNHFRMFPPISNHFGEEQTQNPHNVANPTQLRTELESSRAAVRDELGRRSRGLASEGMRYYNMFWVQKPLDEAERRYYQLKASGVGHEEAIGLALEQYHSRVASRKRVAAIQAEEAKLSGNFITMREASAVLSALVHMERQRFTPHLASQLASERLEASVSGAPRRGTLRWVPSSSAAAASEDGAEGADAPTEAEHAAENVFSFMEDETGKMVVDVADSQDDTLPRLREAASQNTGSPSWYSADGPSYHPATS